MNSKNKISYIVNWIKNYTKTIKSEPVSLIIGVSGGVDSALTSTLCAHTGLKTIAISMPIKQNSSQHDLSLRHLDYLTKNFDNVDCRIIELDNIFRTFEDTMKDFKSDLAFANSRSRLRMVTLYQVAQSNNGIVVGTGNKVEDFGVGFYTKYGDGGVDLSPIADLLKSEVYELGQALGVPKSIMQAPPSDGLWGDARSDEAQIGASYPELEWAMANKDKGKVTSDFNGREQEVFKIFVRHNRANSHKMNPIPVCEVSDTIKH